MPISFINLFIDLLTFGCWSSYWNIEKMLHHKSVKYRIKKIHEERKREKE
jgi:hypothetical protein